MKKFRQICVLLLCLLLTGCTSQTSSQIKETEQDITAVISDTQEPENSIPDEPAVTDLFAMDTYMNLKAWCDPSAIQEGVSLITQLENTLSVTNPESDASHINASGGMPVQISDTTAELLRTAVRIGEESGGALDITIYPVLKEWGFTTQEYQIPDDEKLNSLLSCVDYQQIQLEGNSVTLPENYQLDFGSLAKGYTSDRLMKLFQDYGAQSAIVNLGGNVQTLGRKPDGSLWTVAVINPFSPSDNLCILQIENKAVITSGNYERYFTENGRNYWHIIDPADGYPADNGLVSVTIIGESGLLCDALSTALFVEGTEKAVAHWKHSQDFDMILVTDDGKILISETIADSFKNISAFPVEVISRDET